MHTTESDQVDLLVAGIGCYHTNRIPAPVLTTGGTICCLFERATASPYGRLTLTRFSLDWLMDDGTSYPNRVS